MGMLFYRRPIRLMFLQRRELLIMELFLSTMLKITMKQSFQGICSCRSRKKGSFKNRKWEDEKSL